MNTDGNAISTDIKDSEPDEIVALSADEIKERGSRVDTKSVASEVLGWLERNVEKFIENKETLFRIYLTVDKPDEMPATSELQALYLRIPPPKQAVDSEGKPVVDGDGNPVIDAESENLEAELLDFLNEVTTASGDAMTEDADGLAKLFKRMAFFYEMTGYSKEVGPIIQEMGGVIKINDFFFDSTPMEVTVSHRVAKMENGQMVETGEKRVTKVEESPAAFGIELEIEIWPKSQATSMY